MHRPATRPWPVGFWVQPARSSGKQSRHCVEHESPDGDDAHAGQQEAGELHAHLEAADEDVAAPGTMS